METLFALFVLGILVGSVLGYVAFLKGRNLDRRLQAMQRRQDELIDMLKRMRETGGVAAPQYQYDKDYDKDIGTEASAPDVIPPADPTPEITATTPTAAEPATPPPGVSTPTRASRPAILTHISDNWMVWLGGISLGLAGIFLVAYSIEQGLLGPRARITLGASAGLAMQALAEIFRRRSAVARNVFAALAAAGSLSLFASVLAAFHLYELLSLQFTFVLLCVVALGTMALALLHGPLLAALGLLGAYAVPLLVASDAGSGIMALTYAAIITGAALFLLRYVERRWLWWGALVGALAWWALTLGLADINGLRSLYLALLAVLLVIVPDRDWRLRERHALSRERYHLNNWLSVTPARARDLMLGLMIVTVAHALTVLADPSLTWLWLAPTGLFCTLLFFARDREAVNFVPWLFVVVSLAAWLGAFSREVDGRLALQWIPPDETGAFLRYLTLTALLASGIGLHYYHTLRFQALWASFAAVVPVLLLVTGFLLTAQGNFYWTLTGLLLGLTQLTLACAFAQKAALESLNIWLTFAGQLAIASAAAMVLTPDTLTVVLASQLVSCAVLMRRFGVDLGWLIKLLLTVLIVRLTLNPWLLSYPTDSHWTLWTYGGSTLLTLLALRLLPANAPAGLKRWVEGAALHLAVLFAWTELRFHLHDGDVFAQQLLGVEVALYVLLFGLICLIYHLRSQVATHAQGMYRAFSWLAGLFAAASYVLIIAATLTSLDWLNEPVGPRPIWNLGLLYYTAPVIVFYLNHRFGNPAWRSLWAGLTGVAGFVLVSTQIRHLWTDSYRLDQTFSDGEVMTYSVAWLGLAVAVLIRGASRASQGIYRVGIALLAVVICKIFLIDLSGLQGLARVGSFFGLGLALLGLSYLHQRLWKRDSSL